jgi:hypothetical protein
MINLLKPRGPKVDPFLISELIADGEELENEVATLAAKVAKLQKENHYLRRANKVQPHIKLVVRAHAAAQLLSLWHCAGYRTGRDAAYGMGMSIDDWYKARALLQLARVWDRNGFTTTDPTTIEKQLKLATERARERPDLVGYRIPMNRRPKTFRPG